MLYLLPCYIAVIVGFKLGLLTQAYHAYFTTLLFVGNNTSSLYCISNSSYLSLYSRDKPLSHLLSKISDAGQNSNSSSNHALIVGISLVVVMLQAFTNLSITTKSTVSGVGYSLILFQEIL
jgi:hypothetical protein